MTKVGGYLYDYIKYTGGLRRYEVLGETRTRWKLSNEVYVRKNDLKKVGGSTFFIEETPQVVEKWKRYRLVNQMYSTIEKCANLCDTSLTSQKSEVLLAMCRDFEKIRKNLEFLKGEG